MLKASHALAHLTIEDGFKIQEPLCLVPSGTSAVMVANQEKANTAKLASKLAAQEKQRANADGVPEGLRPLREIIPFTEGRAIGWKITEHVRSAKARKWPGITPFEYRGKSIAICGGGPSIGYCLSELRDLQKSGTRVMAINRTHDYLVNLPQSHGIPWVKPWAGILLEPTPNAAGYIKPRAGVRYYIGSQCAPETFDKFEKHEHFIWHAQSKPELEAELDAREKALMVPAIGSTCGMRAIMLCYMMGFTDIHLFGFDSCYNKRDVENGIVPGGLRLHAYAKPETINDFRTLVMRECDTGKDRKYYGNGNMIAQGDEFLRFVEWRQERLRKKALDPHNIMVHGFGLIPDIAREYGLSYERMH